MDPSSGLALQFLHPPVCSVYTVYCIQCVGCNWLPGDHGQGRTLIVPSTAACFVPLPQHSTVQHSTVQYCTVQQPVPLQATGGHWMATAAAGKL